MLSVATDKVKESHEATSSDEETQRQLLGAYGVLKVIFYASVNNHFGTYGADRVGVKADYEIVTRESQCGELMFQLSELERVFFSTID